MPLDIWNWKPVQIFTLGRAEDIVSLIQEISIRRYLQKGFGG